MLFVFRGVVAAAIPLIIGVFSILGAFLMLRLMSGIVDTSLFALNIATALSLGLAVDYALLMVSRYREEIERAARPARRTARPCSPRRPDRAVPRLHGRRGHGLARLFPQRFLYSVGVAGAVVGLVRRPSPCWWCPPCSRCSARASTRCPCAPARRCPTPRAAGTAWPGGSDEAPGGGGLASTALLLAAAAPLLSTVLTGPSAEAVVPPGKPSYVVKRRPPLRPLAGRGDYGRGRRQGVAERPRRAARPHSRDRRHRRRRRVPRATPQLAYATFAQEDKALPGGHRRRQGDPRGGGRRSPLGPPERASSTRSRALSSHTGGDRDRLRDDALPPLHATAPSSGRSKRSS